MVGCGDKNSVKLTHGDQVAEVLEAFGFHIGRAAGITFA